MHRPAGQSAATRIIFAVFLIAALALCGSAAIPARAQDSFRFNVYGDTRDGHNVHRKLISMMLEKHPEFVLQTGDLVHNGNNADQWKIYDEITQPLRSIMPLFPADGNHDGASPEYLKHVPPGVAKGNPLYYSFDRHSCHFIALAVDEVTFYGPGTKQYQWLVNDLKSARASAHHIFVFFHVPPYSIGSHGSDIDVRRSLCPLFEQYRVTAVFTGHDHNYYRTIRGGIPYIVTGGGGAPLYPCDPSRGAIPGDVYQSVHHFLVCDVDRNTVTFTTIADNGTEIDKFTVSR